MKAIIDAFMKGAIRGSKDAHIIFFSPIIIVWNLLVGQTNKMLAKHQANS